MTNLVRESFDLGGGGGGGGGGGVPRSENLESWFRDNRWPKRSTKWVNSSVLFWGPRLIGVPF